MKTKLLAAWILSLTAAGNVLAAGSALTPFSGLYNYTETGFCTADSTLALPTGYPTQLNNVQIGQHSINPDTTRTFASWVTYAMGIQSGMTNPTSLLTTSIDPSSTSAPQAMLKETPIQWSSSVIGVNASIDSELAYTAPYSSKPVFDTSSSKNEFVFITSFPFSTPANLGGRKTGYAVYVYTGAAWVRHLAYITTASNVAATNVVLETNYDRTYIVGTTPYTYHCVRTSHLTK